MFQITYSKKALNFLRKQDKTTQYRLFTAISKLPLEGNIYKVSYLFVLSMDSCYQKIVDKYIKECEYHVFNYRCSPKKRLKSLELFRHHLFCPTLKK